MTKLNLEWGQELKLLAIAYFSVTFVTITLSDIDILTLKSILSTFLSAFGSVGISPLTKEFRIVDHYVQNNFILDFKVITTAVVFSLSATLGMVLSIIALNLIDRSLGSTLMPRGFIKVAVPLGVAIAVLNTTRFSTMIYSVIPSVLAINVSLCEEQISSLNKIIVILMTIVISLLATMILGALVEKFMVLLCIMPSVLLALLRGRSVTEHGKEEAMDEEKEVQEKNLEKSTDVESKVSEKSYKKVYLIRLAS